MTSWDAVSLNKRFKFAAGSAETSWQTIGPTMGKGTGHQAAYDMKKAEYMVFNHLHGRDFVNSREALLAELRNMRAHPPEDNGVNDEALFRNTYERTIASLIDELIEKAM